MTIERRECVRCGDAFVVRWVSSTQRFCCKSCAARDRWGDHLPEKRACAHCGERFSVRYLSSRKKFCCVACANEAIKKPGAPIERKCGYCGERFSVRYPSSRKKFCCMSCSARANHLAAGHRPQDKTERECLHCGELFVPCWSKQKYCSYSCAAVGRWQDPKQRARHVAAMNTPEYRAQASQQSKLRWADPKYKARLIAALTAAMTTAEFRAGAGQRSRLRWADPAARKRHSERLQIALQDREIYSNRIKQMRQLGNDPEVVAKRKKTWANNLEEYRLSYKMLRLLLGDAEVDKRLKGRKPGSARLAAAHRVMQDAEREFAAPAK